MTKPKFILEGLKGKGSKEIYLKYQKLEYNYQHSEFGDKEIGTHCKLLDFENIKWIKEEVANKIFNKELNEFMKEIDDICDNSALGYYGDYGKITTKDKIRQIFKKHFEGKSKEENRNWNPTNDSY